MTLDRRRLLAFSPRHVKLAHMKLRIFFKYELLSRFYFLISWFMVLGVIPFTDHENCGSTIPEIMKYYRYVMLPSIIFLNKVSSLSLLGFSGSVIFINRLI